jgi:Amt family ammonium transporter
MAPDVSFLVDNLWILIAALLVFTMTIAVGFLEVGELGEDLWRSLHKTMLITGVGLVMMILVGFDTAFAPTVLGGFIGNPFYHGALAGGFDPTLSLSQWWSQTATGNGSELTLGSYFLFEDAFATVTLALVGVIVLRKMRLRAFLLYSIPYFAVIWALPAAWIWNPSGWLAKMGMVDFAGGLVVHGAAGAAGLALLWQIWREEKARGYTESPQIPLKITPTWLTLGVLLLWVGWFGFNPGSVLAFNAEVPVVVLTTFLCAGTSYLSTMGTKFLVTRKDPGMSFAANGIIMGLIVITPLAGFVSPGSAVILGLLCGPLFVLGEHLFERFRWFSDPVGLLPGHLVGGLFGVMMIPLFAQNTFAALSGAPGLTNGLLFGGGWTAVHQAGVEAFGIVVVLVTVFVLSFVSIWVIAKILGGVTRHPDAPEPQP